MLNAQCSMLNVFCAMRKIPHRLSLPDLFGLRSRRRLCRFTDAAYPLRVQSVPLDEGHFTETRNTCHTCDGQIAAAENYNTFAVRLAMRKPVRSAIRAAGIA